MLIRLKLLNIYNLLIKLDPLDPWVSYAWSAGMMSLKKFTLQSNEEMLLNLAESYMASKLKRIWEKAKFVVKAE